MVAAESLIDLQETYNEKEDDIDSLPSTSSSASDVYSDTDSDAQAEWDRSLEQLQLLLTMMIVPWVGKYFGRKFAYWSMSCLVCFIFAFFFQSFSLSITTWFSTARDADAVHVQGWKALTKGQ